MITELTPEQTATFPKYVQKWIDIGMSTEPCNFNEAKKAAKKAYKLAGLTEPKIFIGPVNNPVEGYLAEKILYEWVGREWKSNAELNKALLEEVNKRVNEPITERVSVSSQVYGNHNYWLSFYDFFETEMNVESCKKLEGLKDMALHCGWWTPLKNVCIFQHRPLEIHLDEQNRAHNLNGPAIKFRGTGIADVYVIHGIRVKKEVVDKNFTWKDIDRETNLELRRIMIDLYGQSRYIIDSGAEVVATDDFGTVYRKELPGDEPVMMVKVVNSTPEPDGSFKDYFIRVDPKAYGGVDSGLKAVASTWRNPDGSFVFKKPEDYDPSIQT